MEHSNIEEEAIQLNREEEDADKPEIDKEEEQDEVEKTEKKEPAPAKSYKYTFIMVVLFLKILNMTIFYPITCVGLQACNTNGVLFDTYTSFLFVISFFILMLSLILDFLILYSYNKLLLRISKVIMLVISVYLLICAVIVFMSLSSKNTENLSARFIALSSVEKLYYDNKQDSFDNSFTISVILAGVFFLLSLLIELVKFSLFWSFNISRHLESNSKYRLSIDTFNRSSLRREELEEPYDEKNLIFDQLFKKQV